MTTKVDTRAEKNFQIETFRIKGERDERFAELRKNRGIVKFSGVREFASTWSVAWPIRIRHRRREHDHQLPSGPCPPKRRRSRYWRRHPALHSMALAAQQKGKIKP